MKITDQLRLANQIDGHIIEGSLYLRAAERIEKMEIAAKMLYLALNSYYNSNCPVGQEFVESALRSYEEL